MPRAITRTRSWVFTLNNPTEEEIEKLKRCEVKYIVWGEETAPETGTPHLQGYVEFEKTKRLGSAKKHLGISRIHIESRMGTLTQAIDYCKKDGKNIFEKGKPLEWKKMKLNEIMNHIEDPSFDVLNIQTSIAYVNKQAQIDRIWNRSRPKRNWSMRILIFWGKTRTGKSYTAHKNFKEAYTGSWPKGGRWWWDEYRGEETVILDEFDHQVKINPMLKLFDQYPWRVEYKGGSTEFRSKNIIITSNFHPRDWYPNAAAERKEPLLARIEEFGSIVHFTKEYNYQTGETKYFQQWGKNEKKETKYDPEEDIVYFIEDQVEEQGEEENELDHSNIDCV